MRLYPAIDLRGGNCVRLYQGDYEQETIYGSSPVDQAMRFVEAGADWIHMVDLDAALTGEPTNREAIAEVCAQVGVPVQVGGGVRTLEAARALVDLGVERVVIGTAALESPELVAAVSAELPVAVGLDARNGEVATHGWTQSSGRSVSEVAAEFAEAGVSALVVTDISLDGTLEGPDVAGLSALLSQTKIPLIASGGVGTLAHLATLAGVSAAGRRFEGAIVGKALYEGKFSVEEAIEASRGSG